MLAHHLWRNTATHRTQPWHLALNCKLHRSQTTRERQGGSETHWGSEYYTSRDSLSFYRSWCCSWCIKYRQPQDYSTCTNTSRDSFGTSIILFSRNSNNLCLWLVLNLYKQDTRIVFLVMLTPIGMHRGWKFEQEGARSQPWIYGAIWSREFFIRFTLGWSKPVEYKPKFRGKMKISQHRHQSLLDAWCTIKKQIRGFCGHKRASMDGKIWLEPQWELIPNEHLLITLVLIRCCLACEPLFTTGGQRRATPQDTI